MKKERGVWGFQRKQKEVAASPTIPAPEITRLPESPVALAKRPAITTLDITDNILPKNNLTLRKEEYLETASAPLNIFRVTRDGDDNEPEYVVVAPSLTASTTNALLHHAAPSKAFGLDTEDLLEDWEKLYKPENDGLRVAHETMPGWQNFESERDKVYGIIKRNYSDRQKEYNDEDKRDQLVPVVQFKRKDEKIEVILDAPDDHVQKTLAAALPEQISDPERISSGMGLMYLTAYSQESVDWPERDTFNGTGRTNLIGATQVLAYAYREVAKVQSSSNTPGAKDLQQSRLLTALADYADTGILTPTKSAGTDVSDILEEKKNNAKVERKKKLMQKTSTVVLFAGIGTAFVAGIAGVTNRVAIDNLKSSYDIMAPTDSDIDQAVGAQRALEKVLRARPELEPLLETAIADQQTIFQQRNAKDMQLEAAVQPLEDRIFKGSFVVVGGIIIAIGSQQLHRKSK